VETLNAPRDLRKEKTFVISYDFDARDFTLMLRNGHSYDLGLFHDALHYFWTIGLEVLGESAMQSAMNFGAAQVISSENRSFGLELEAHDKVDPKATEEGEVLVL
jgi:hypothetical protein